MKDNYVQASICADCQDLIVLRQLGNVWKLPYMPSRQDKKEHEPTFIFSTLFDARRVSKEANDQFWKDKKLCEDPEYANLYDEDYEKYKKIYNKNRLESIKKALSILGYSTE